MYSYTEDLIFTSANTHISSAKISLNGKKKKLDKRKKKKQKQKQLVLLKCSLLPIYFQYSLSKASSLYMEPLAITDFFTFSFSFVSLQVNER